MWARLIFDVDVGVGVSVDVSVSVGVDVSVDVSVDVGVDVGVDVIDVDTQNELIRPIPAACSPAACSVITNY